MLDGLHHAFDWIPLPRIVAEPIGKAFEWLILRPLLRVLWPLYARQLTRKLRGRASWRDEESEEVVAEYDAAMQLALKHRFEMQHETLLRLAREPDEDAVGYVRCLLQPAYRELPADGVVATCANGDSVRVWGRVGFTLRQYRQVGAVGIPELLERCEQEVIRAIRKRPDAFDASLRLAALGKLIARAMDLRDNDSAFHVRSVDVRRVDRV